MEQSKKYGIMYLQEMPDGHQEFVMHKVVWNNLYNAEKAISILTGTVACPTIVELRGLDNESQPRLETKAPETVVKPQGTTPVEPKHLDPKENIAFEYRSDKDGNVVVKKNGQVVSDPEQQKAIQEQVDEALQSLLGSFDFDRILSTWF